MGQRQSYRSRVSTVLGLVLRLVWGFLGLVMSAMITPAARAVAPSAKSAPMCWRSLYIGAWLVAFNAAGCDLLAGALKAQRDAVRERLSGWEGMRSHQRACACTRDLIRIARLTECCCCKAADGGLHCAHTVATTADALETLCAIDSSNCKGGAPCAIGYPLPCSHRTSGHPCIGGHVHGQCRTCTNAEMSVHGWIALTLGVLFSLIVGCGLMALVFYSSRRGYDERAHAAQSHREVP